MYWPTLQLTRGEARQYTLYPQPGISKRQVLYRVHPGEITITNNVREDVENVQIARRARVAALTASGDLHNMEIEIYDSSGERYTMGFVPCAALFPGVASDMRGAIFTQGAYAAASGVLLGKQLTDVATVPRTLGAHVFEPNLVLLPNQALAIKARALVPPRALEKVSGGDPTTYETFTLSFCLHVWEFPVE